jgi:hypothetical protein
MEMMRLRMSAWRDVIHGAEEIQIFASAEAAVEAFVASGMISELAAGGGRRAFDVVTDKGRADRAWEESGSRGCAAA